MAAIRVKGTVVSIDEFKGKRHSDGKDFQVFTNYVVNGGGAPVPVRIVNGPNPFKAGQGIDVPVRVSIYNNEVQYTLEREAS